MASVAPVYGLVLAGGESRRMGRDKAALMYHGRTQVQWAYDLLNTVCERSFVSVRLDQRAEPARAALPQIVDRHHDVGPLAGIDAALNTHREVAWLILACDLPFLSRDTLADLLAHRDSTRIATAYRSAYDSLPEPLCAIWEPHSRDLVLQWIGSDQRCPRKLLTQHGAALVDQRNSHELDNINTPTEFDAARASLG